MPINSPPVFGSRISTRPTLKKTQICRRRTCPERTGQCPPRPSPTRRSPRGPDHIAAPAGPQARGGPSPAPRRARGASPRAARLPRPRAPELAAFVGDLAGAAPADPGRPSPASPEPAPATPAAAAAVLAGSGRQRRPPPPPQVRLLPLRPRRTPASSSVEPRTACKSRSDFERLTFSLRTLIFYAYFDRP